MRVWAVNATNRDPGGGTAAARAGRAAVQLDDALALRRLVGGAGQRGEVPDLARPRQLPSGTNCVALRLPIVIVPVLSSSSVSTSPATSTALPLLAMRFARRARSMPAMPMAASSAPIVVGIRQTSSATSVGMSVPRLLSPAAPR